ncbi:MAG: formimidoylglutamase, partial [Pseudomonadota bacterium]|nr:formimidoylglutamase [Pseudomonadota bacterium]
MFKWQGRIDSEDGIEGLRWHQKVNELEVGEDNSLANSVTLVGFESDLGVVFNKGRVGAAAGPNAIRQALANLPWHWPSAALADLGNVTAKENLAQAQTQYA